MQILTKKVIFLAKKIEILLIVLVLKFYFETRTIFIDNTIKLLF